MFNRVKGISAIRNFDYILLILVLILTVFGYVVLKSATMTMNSGPSILKTQLISIFLGIGICITLSFIDYTYFRIWGFIFYGGAILLLIYVIPFGYGRDIQGIGSNGWILIGGYMFQPAEVGKIAYMMAIPALFERLKEEFKFNNLMLAAVASLVPLILILLQPEVGMTIVLAIGLIAIIFVYGIRYRYILIGLGTFAVTVPLIWLFALKDFQKKRIHVLFNPEHDLSGAAYQTDRARVAIGSGQLTGSGLYGGIHSQSVDSIPVKESDFIFAVIGEELGFIGSMVVILLFTAILIRCIYIAATSKDRFGAYMVTGLTAMMAFHFIENVGMNIGMLPVTGIPLPFVSAGGSAMITNYAAIGLIISVSIRRKT